MKDCLKLRPREWALYKYLRQVAIEDPTRWVSHKEICTALPELFTLNHLACKKLCSSSIQKVVIAINDSPYIEKIILYDKQMYKLASCSEEAQKFLNDKLLDKGARIISRYWKLSNKVAKDGQGKLLSTRGDLIDERSKARRFVETYVNRPSSHDNHDTDI